MMMCTKDQNNLSVADQIVNIIRFRGVSRLSLPCNAQWG